MGKENSIRGDLWNNKIICKKILTSFKLEYDNIDRQFLLDSKKVGLLLGEIPQVVFIT